MIRHCDGCGASFEAHTGRARWCSERCRGRARRRALGVPVTPSANTPVPTRGRSLTTKTRAALADGGRSASALGAVALTLARRIDAGTEDGHALVALSKEWRLALEGALERPVPADPVDELRQRRERRRR